MPETEETPVETYPWRRALLWLLFLGPFFFLSYGFANALAAARNDVGSIVFPWEAFIPFLPWSIVPYWSLDLLYGLSFLGCRTRKEVDTHAFRLLAAQIVAVLCFILFPLRFSFPAPLVDGAHAPWFEALRSFDLPFNQAPSLHVALSLIVWDAMRRRLRTPWRLLLHAWMLLVALSTLTTWQHHFIDAPTGALLGLLCLWLWPWDNARVSPIHTQTACRHAIRHPTAWHRGVARKKRRLGICYLAGAVLCARAAMYGGIWLWMCWPAVSLLLVALIYLLPDAPGFQKDKGCPSLAARWLLAPYLAGAWLNSRLWTRAHPHPAKIANGLWLGRLPGEADLRDGGFVNVPDLCPELCLPRGAWRITSLPWLDMIPPDTAQLQAAAATIEALRGQGDLLVCCALGYSRSACAVAAWLLTSGQAKSVEEALARIAARRPQIALGPLHRQALEDLRAASAMN